MAVTKPPVVFRINEFLLPATSNAVMTAQSALIVIVKSADSAPAGTVTEGGNEVIAGLLLTRLSVRAAGDELGK